MSEPALSAPPEPSFGEALPLAPSQTLLDLLARRRSASAGALAAPGPNPGELADILRLAARAPDHGKLFPWRFVVIEGEAKEKLAAALSLLAQSQPDPVKAQASLFKLTTPPLAVAVISSPTPGKIPEWEQRLSAGAVCTLMLLAAQGFGYGANWITDWYAYTPEATALIGLKADEQVAGFIYMGTATEAPLERPRPEMSALVGWL